MSELRVYGMNDPEVGDEYEMYKDSVDVKIKIWERCKKAEDELRKTQHALWLAREWRAWCEGQFWLVIESTKPRDIYHLLLTNRIHRTPNEWITYWHKVEQLCKKKVEEYK